MFAIHLAPNFWLIWLFPVAIDSWSVIFELDFLSLTNLSLTVAFAQVYLLLAFRQSLFSIRLLARHIRRMQIVFRLVKIERSLRCLHGRGACKLFDLPKCLILSVCNQPTMRLASCLLGEMIYLSLVLYVPVNKMISINLLKSKTRLTV